MPWKGTAEFQPPAELDAFFKSHPHLTDDPAQQLAFAAAVSRRLGADASSFLDGVKAYAVHPAERSDTPHQELWAAHGAQVLDYGPPQAPAVLLVPSLVNRHTILDLMPGASLVESLRTAGLRPLILKWGDPFGPARAFSLQAYVDDVLGAALSHIHTLTSSPVPVVGYCMGGNLALAAALRHPEHISRLALLATPWDFHAGSAPLRSALSASRSVLEPLLDSYGAAPVDLLQALFASLDPMLVGRKYRKFSRMDPQSERAMKFVILEDWVNDGVELAGPVAQECLFNWYLDNTPARGQWTIAGKTIDPGELACPALVMIPETDRIVPPASARALAGALPAPDVIDIPLGHVGMMAGGKAVQKVHTPLAAWVQA